MLTRRHGGRRVEQSLAAREWVAAPGVGTGHEGMPLGGQRPSMADDLGPVNVTFLREPRIGLEAFVVVDDVASGPFRNA